MADTIKFETPVPSIELGGKTWYLKVTHTTLERFSSLSRCSLADFDTVLLRYDMMVLLLWLMMCEQRADLTRDKLREWLEALPVMRAVELVNTAVGDAVAYSFPKPEEPETDGEEPLENPTDADI